MSDKLTMKEAEALAKQKGYDFRSAIGLLKWLFEGRVVRTINGEPPDRNGDARLDALDVDLDSLTDSEVARILGGWAAGELDGNWNARAADKLAIARLIALTGDVAGDAYFDGSQDIQIGTAVDCLSTLEIDALMESAMAIGG